MWTLMWSKIILNEKKGQPWKLIFETRISLQTSTLCYLIPCNQEQQETDKSVRSDKQHPDSIVQRSQKWEQMRSLSNRPLKQYTYTWEITSKHIYLPPPCINGLSMITESHLHRWPPPNHWELFKQWTKDFTPSYIDVVQVLTIKFRPCLYEISN